MTWRIRGTSLEFCSCDPGCGCNFRGFPTSVQGNCEAFLCHLVEDGHYEDTDLSGSTIAWALWWPGAIHDRGGRGHAYIDCRTDEQFDALARIVRGEAGYEYFKIFNSTFTEPTAVERAAVEVTLDGRSSWFSVDGVGGGRMEPLRNPVTGEENHVRIVKPDAFIWKEGEIAQSASLRVELPEMAFDLSGRHAVFAQMDWAA